MPGIGFGRRPKPRKFEYIPRYYDEAKDNLEQRLTQYDKKPDDRELAKERIRYGLRNRMYADPAYRSGENKKSNIRLLYIIVILCFVSYLILSSDSFIKIIDGLS